MGRRLSIGLFCCFALIEQTLGQVVEIPRDTSSKVVAPITVAPPVVVPPVVKPEMHIEKAIAVQPVQPAKAVAVSPMPVRQAFVPAPKPAASTAPKAEVRSAQAVTKTPVTEPAKPKVQASAPPLKKAEKEMEQANVARAAASVAIKQEVAATPPVSKPDLNFAAPSSLRMETAFTKLADGFDFPVGKPSAEGYYKARGFRIGGHVGEDWNGTRGGDTDLGDPIYSIGDGIVVFARDCHQGWGNVIIVRHSYREGGTIKTIDSLYGHLSSLLVRRGQPVSRGQKIATMGNARGLYDTHLHLEVRKNITIGMSRDLFASNAGNYHDPSQFIASHRQLPASKGTHRVAMNTFAHDAKIRWEKLRNYAHSHHRGTSESSTALKKAVAAKR